MIDREKFKRTICLIAEKSGYDFILGTGLRLTPENLDVMIKGIEKGNENSQLELMEAIDVAANFLTGDDCVVERIKLDMSTARNALPLIQKLFPIKLPPIHTGVDLWALNKSINILIRDDRQADIINMMITMLKTGYGQEIIDSIEIAKREIIERN